MAFTGLPKSQEVGSYAYDVVPERSKPSFSSSVIINYCFCHQMYPDMTGIHLVYDSCPVRCNP